jgi:thiaminase/transcriptional activator TenA
MNVFNASRLVQGAGELWHLATSSPFLDAVSDGSLPEEAFHRWLQQDRLFVLGLTSFAAIMAARVPREAQRSVIHGLAALNDELDWFEKHLGRRGLQPDIPTHPTCHRYVDYLLASAYTKTPDELLAIYFGVEAAYVQAWGRMQPQGPYAEFIDRWTNEAFVAYVVELMRLTEGSEAGQAEFDRVCRFEAEFWTMTWAG